MKIKNMKNNIWFIPLSQNNNKMNVFINSKDLRKFAKVLYCQIKYCKLNPV